MEQQQQPQQPDERRRVALKPSDIDSVCVCIIMPGMPAGISADTTTTLFRAKDLFAKYRVGFEVCLVQGLSYEHALAEVCARAMQWTNMRRLFFLDTDIAFDAQWLLMMCAVDRDILCGTYEQRTAPGEWCLNTTDAGEFEGEYTWDPVIGQNLIPINDTGFGAVLVKRGVIERLQRLHHSDEPGKGLNYRSMDPLVEHESYALWDPWIYLHGGIRRRCAGDTNFFKRARDAGYQPFALPDMVIDHARMGPKSLSQWVAAKKLEAQTTLETAEPSGPSCSKCGAVPAPFTIEHGEERVCRACAGFAPAGDVAQAE